MGRVYKWWLSTAVGSRWEKHFIGAELILGIVLAVALAIWSEQCGGKGGVSQVLWKARPTLYPAFVSLFGSLFGFVITAMSIIVTWVGRKEFDDLRARPGYRQLWPAFSSAILWLALASIASLVAMCLDKEKDGENGQDLQQPWVWYPLFGVVLIACFRLARCVWALNALIHLIAPAITKSDREEGEQPPPPEPTRPPPPPPAPNLPSNPRNPGNHQGKKKR